MLASLEQYLFVHWAWTVAGAATFTAGCGLSTAGEEAIGEFVGGTTTIGDGGDGDGGAGYGSSSDGGGAFIFSETGGPSESDAGFSGFTDSASANCDFSGTWGSLIQVDVDWAPQGLNLQAFILAPGSGTIKQWIKGVRVQHGSSLVDTTVVCGVDLPDFRGTQAVAGETYGVVFPNSLFDGMFLPTFEVDATVTGKDAGATYTSSPAAALLGLTMANPTTDPWPQTVTTATDPDRDGKPGVTIDEAQGALSEGGSYSLVPVGIPAPFAPVVVAQKLYVAIRQVTAVTGTVTDCDHISGTVAIAQIAGQYAINSHVLGCELVDGGDCTTSGTSSQASFVDNTQPVFTPSGSTAFTSVRLASDATCATVRQALR